MTLQVGIPRIVCALPFAALLSTASAEPASANDNLADVVTTRSLFRDDGAAAVSDLFPDTKVGSLFGEGVGADASDYFANLAGEQQKLIIDRAYPNLDAVWPDRTLFVCWEEFGDADAADRALVQQAVTDSWQAASQLKFEGWQACQDASVGIRITVRDEGPHTLELGKELDGVKGGVVLNFTYAVWEPGCAKSEKIRKFCTRTTAVHEFGHALGFSHEQNRPDTPDDCKKAQKPQGEDGTSTEMTPWDPHSVMNYCNLDYLNNGALSDFDKLAVAQIYGKPG